MLAENLLISADYHIIYKYCVNIFFVESSIQRCLATHVVCKFQKAIGCKLIRWSPLQFSSITNCCKELHLKCGRFPGCTFANFAIRKNWSCFLWKPVFYYFEMWLPLLKVIYYYGNEMNVCMYVKMYVCLL